MQWKQHHEFPVELASAWDNLLSQSAVNVPFMRSDYLKTWWQTRGGGEWPQDAALCILSAWEDDRLIAIAPFFLAPWEGQPTLLLLGSIEISDYLDLIARPQDLARVCESLLTYLADPAAQLPAFTRLDLYNVMEVSPSVPALQSAAQKTDWTFASKPFRPALTIPLPGDWETYLAGIDKKQRHEIRRKMRRAENTAEVRWYIVEDSARLDSEMEDFLRLMELDVDKARFLTAPMRENFQATMRTAFDAGYLMLAFLEINGQKAAAYYCFDYQNQLWVYNSGIDNTFMSYSPGWVLASELIKWANDQHRAAFDFMRGDEDYKIRFGAQRRDVLRLTLKKPDSSE